MTWTAPATAVTGNTLTAAFWNAQVRDNMLETAAATAAAAGDIVYADAANSMGSVLTHPGVSWYIVSDGSNGWVARQDVEDVNLSDGSTSGTTSSTSYTSVLTVGEESVDLPSVTVTTGTAAIVIVSAQLVSNDSAGEDVNITFSISGATTLAASVNQSVSEESGAAGDAHSAAAIRVPTLTAGSNTFQMEASVSGGTGTIARPRLLVVPR